jgi:2'-5' RNA ligase
MNRRCIFLTPATAQWDRLQRLRLSFDPLAEKLPPHITVVFPFRSPWPREQLAAVLERHASALPIPFSLGPPAARDGWLQFPLARGAAEVARLHDAIHGDLPAGLRADLPYVPHLTFGRIRPARNPASILGEAAQALPCDGLLGRLVLERIGASGTSIIEWESAPGNGWPVT